MQDQLRILALRAVRARAQYLEALAELVCITSPLGMTLTHKAQLEAAINEVANDDNTNIQELDSIAALAIGRQH